MLFKTLIIFISFPLNISMVLAGGDLKFTFGTQDSDNKSAPFEWGGELKQDNPDVQSVEAGAMRHVGFSIETRMLPTLLYFYPGQDATNSKHDSVFVEQHRKGVFDHYFGSTDKIMTYTEAIDDANYAAGNVLDKTSFTGNSGISTISYLDVKDGWTIIGGDLKWVTESLPSVASGGYRSVGGGYRSVGGGYRSVGGGYRGEDEVFLGGGEGGEPTNSYETPAEHMYNDCKLIPSDKKTEKKYSQITYDSMVDKYPIFGLLASKDALVLRYISFQVLSKGSTFNHSPPKRNTVSQYLPDGLSEKLSECYNKKLKTHRFGGSISQQEIQSSVSGSAPSFHDKSRALARKKDIRSLYDE